MGRQVELSKEQLEALDTLIEKGKSERAMIPAALAAVGAVTAIVAAGAGVVQAVTAVVDVVQGSKNLDPLDTIAANALQGKLSADDLIQLRKAAVQKK